MELALTTLKGSYQSRCKICNSPSKSEIEESLLMPGMSNKAIAARFNLNVTNIQRHRPHMLRTLDNARALSEVESVSALYKRALERSKSLWRAAEALFETRPGDAARLAEVARRYDESLSKFAEAPGFRDTPAPTTINAPDARIVVTQESHRQSEQ